MKWSMYEFHVFFIIALSLIQTTHLTKVVLSKKGKFLPRTGALINNNDIFLC